MSDPPRTHGLRLEEPFPGPYRRLTFHVAHSAPSHRLHSFRSRAVTPRKLIDRVVNSPRGPEPGVQDPCLGDLDPSLGTPVTVSRHQTNLSDRVGWIPERGCDPAFGSRAPHSPPSRTIQSTRQRRSGSRMARPPAPYGVLQRLQEYDPRYVRPMTATNTVNNLHPHFARLPGASNAAISRFARTLGAWRVFTTLHTLRRLDPSLLVGVFFRE